MRWRYLLPRALYIVLLLGTAAALPGGGRMRDKYRYREGDIARERVVAPYDFRVQKDETLLRREQQQAATAIPPVFVVDTRVSSDALARWKAPGGCAAWGLRCPRKALARSCHRPARGACCASSAGC